MSTMNRLFVFSDLHGSTEQLRKVINLIEKEKATHVFFAGDLGLKQLKDQNEVLASLKQEYTAIRGNIDPPWVFINEGYPVPLLYTFVTFEKRTIAITHGDFFTSWKDIPIELGPEDIVIMGHTHIPVLRHLPNQPIELNPGSVTESRSIYQESYAVITSQVIQIKDIETGLPMEPFTLYLEAVKHSPSTNSPLQTGQL